MKYLWFLLLSTNTWASYTLLNFNTMCDVCHGSHLVSYQYRLSFIQQLIESHQPDLISLQELRLKSQLDFLFRKKSDYQIIYSDGIINYTDSSLAFNTKKFELLKKGTYWLGSQPEKFNWGWKTALPRTLIWVKLKDLKTSQVFYFMSSHFDNRKENLNGSAKFLQKISIDYSDAPIIFAADTNITSDMPEFEEMSQNFKTIFSEIEHFNIIGEIHSPQDLCYLRKGDEFPECMVEHVFISKNSPWSFESMTVDLSQTVFGFPSDHRVFIIRLKDI